jgi:hypothetical protein
VNVINEINREEVRIHFVFYSNVGNCHLSGTVTGCNQTKGGMRQVVHVAHVG